jgi:hypothetical protein
MSIDTRPRLNLTQPLHRLRRPVVAGSGEAADPGRPLPEAPHVAGRRNPRWIALGVAALCLGGLLSYGLYTQVAAQSSVVAMAATVHRGAVIEASDLTTATLSGTSAISTVPVEELTALVGHRAPYDLVEGSLVPASVRTETAVPATGRAVIGVKLAQGRAPTELLTASAPVRLVALPAADQPAPATPTQTWLGRVVDTHDGADGISILVNVDVAANDAPAIAVLAAQERIAVLRDADR